MTRQAVLCLSSFLLVACSSGGHQLRPTPTPTAASQDELRAEVEKAYLNSWAVYSHAVESWDTSQLPTAFANSALEQVQREVAKLREANHQIVVHVQHDYAIGNLTPRSAVVVDNYINSGVLLDAQTKRPISSPGATARVTQVFTLERTNGIWKIVRGFTSGQ